LRRRVGGAGVLGVGVLLALGAAPDRMCGQGAAASVQATGVQPVGMPRVTFAFEREGVPVPKFTLEIGPNGAGRYAGDEAAPVVHGDGVAAWDKNVSTKGFERGFVLSRETTGKIFALAGELKHFNVACASKVKNIADTGTKTLSYAGADGSGSCTYNYSENKKVDDITTILLGIVETMDEGRRLDDLHRYDRLGLDDAITFLAQEVSEGRALEVGTIAASLHSLADDAEVMQRVRARANTLLALVPAELR